MPCKLSVIIPVHNGERKVGRAARQILNQDFRDLELILVENGSTDRTWEICCSLAQDDSRCIVLQSDVKSTLIARRVGIEHAAGEYITFCDADDGYRNNQSLGRLIAAAEKTGADITQFGHIINRFGWKHEALRVGEALTIDRRELLEKEIAGVGGGYAQKINLSVWTKIYKAEVLKSILPSLETPLINAEDLYLNCCAFFSDETQSVAFVPLCEYVYNTGIGVSGDGIASVEKMFVEYRYFKMKALELANSYGVTGTPVYLWHRESLRYLDALIRLYILRGDSKASVCERIRRYWSYEFVEIAREYFVCYAQDNELDEEMLRFASETNPERYYDYCVQRIGNIKLERAKYSVKSMVKSTLRGIATRL